MRAAGRTINHGIYRDFPTRFRNSEGIWFDVPFGLIEVRRDGKPEPWRTTEGEHGVRAYFGDAEQRLEPGEHTYTSRTAPIASSGSSRITTSCSGS